MLVLLFSSTLLFFRVVHPFYESILHYLIRFLMWFSSRILLLYILFLMCCSWLVLSLVCFLARAVAHVFSCLMYVMLLLFSVW